MKKRIVRISSVILIFLVGISACGAPVVVTESTEAQLTTKSPSPETSVPPTEPAEIIFHNGMVITIEQAQPLAEAVAIRNKLIQAVGSNEEILALQGPDTILVDLQGKTLMPGFISGHTHLLAFPDRQGKTVAEAQEAALSYGYTTASEMWADENMANQMLQLEQEGNLRLRVNLFPHYNEGTLENQRSSRVANWFPGQAPILDPQRKLRIPGIKIFVDGDLTPARGCWALSEPYLPEGLAGLPCASDRGDLYWPNQDELNQVVVQAQAAGYRVSFHAMGDRAIQAALDAIEYALAGESNDIYRHMIQHNSLLRPDQMERYVELGIIASVRGYADICDPNLGMDTFGPERRVWYANRWTLPNLDMHAFIETDFGWTADAAERFANRNMDPFVNIQGIVTLDYVTADGSVCKKADWVLSEGTTVERALEMFTSEPAYAISMEDYIGSIKPGKFADLVILSGNPLEGEPVDLLDLRVLMTMVDGKVEYCATGKDALCPEMDLVAAPIPTSTTTTAESMQVDWNCDAGAETPVHVSRADAIQTYIKWAASTADQVKDYMAAVQPSLQVDGVSLPSVISHGEVTRMEGRDLFFVQSVFEVGILTPGTHEIRTTLTFDHLITDGYDSYGPGSQNVTMQGVCTVINEP